MHFRQLTTRVLGLGAAAGVLALAGLARPAAAQGRNYIALGDSYAYGYTTAAGTPSGFGDQGYVRPFADYLATRFGGTRPTLTNLAVPGETTTSFFTGSPTVTANQPGFPNPPYPPGLVDAPLRNQNYNDNYPNIQDPQFQPPAPPAAGNPQATALQNRIAAIKGGGGTVDFVTVQLGGNDILALFGQSGFTSLPAVQREQILAAQFARIQANYTTLLTAVRTNAPEADIYVLGYADPFAGLGALNPLGPLSTQLTLQANSLINQVATSFGARYVDIYTPFRGNEVQLTLITTIDNGIPNFHPNAAGYNVIGQRLTAVAAAAPEPGAAWLLAVACLPGAVLVLRRR